MCCRILDFKEFFDVYFSDVNIIFVCCRCCGISFYFFNIFYNDRLR